MTQPCSPERRDPVPLSGEHVPVSSTRNPAQAQASHPRELESRNKDTTTLQPAEQKLQSQRNTSQMQEQNKTPKEQLTQVETG